MLLFLETIPHLLDPDVGLEFCTGFCIFESHFLEIPEHIKEYEGIDTLVLIFRLDTDEKQVKGIRLLEIHILDQIPPADREEVSAAFLERL